MPVCGASVTVPPAAGPEVAKGTRKKKYKKVRVTAITQHTALDTATITTSTVRDTKCQNES